MSSKESQKKAIRLAVSQHLSLYGPKEWERVFSQFPDVSRATLYRHIKDVREEMEARASDQGGAQLRAMQKRIRNQIKTPAVATQKLKATLPVLPSPSVLLGMGDGVDDLFDFMGNIKQLMNDSNMMRSASVKINADGTEKLSNPMLMDKSIARRLELLETWLKSQDMVWNIEKMQELFHIIIDEVGKTDPDTQQAIIAKMRTLNNRQGFNANARIG